MMHAEYNIKSKKKLEGDYNKIYATRDLEVVGSYNKIIMRGNGTVRIYGDSNTVYGSDGDLVLTGENNCASVKRLGTKITWVVERNGVSQQQTVEADNENIFVTKPYGLGGDGNVYDAYRESRRLYAKRNQRVIEVDGQPIELFEVALMEKAGLEDWHRAFVDGKSELHYLSHDDSHIQDSIRIKMLNKEEIKTKINKGEPINIYEICRYLGACYAGIDKAFRILYRHGIITQEAYQKRELEMTKIENIMKQNAELLQRHITDVQNKIDNYRRRKV